MIYRCMLAVLALALSACQPWKVVRESDSNPLAGKTGIGVHWLEWSGVWVDEVPEQTWMASHGDSIQGEEFPFTGKVCWAKAGDPRMSVRGRFGVRFTGIANKFFELFQTTWCAPA